MIVTIVYNRDRNVVGVFSEDSELPAGKDFTTATTMLDGATGGVPNWRVHVYKEGIQYGVTRFYGLMREPHEDAMYKIYYVSAVNAAEALRKVLSDY
jgi:hypothetical protein